MAFDSTSPPGDDPASLHLRFLGGFSVLLCGKPLTGFAYDKMRALLAYLVLESPRSLPRERLAELFWPDVREETARGNLRRTLHHLRKALGDEERVKPFLAGDRKMLAFQASAA